MSTERDGADTAAVEQDSRQNSFPAYPAHATVRRMKTLLMAALLVLVGGCATAGDGTYRGKVFLGLGTEPVELPPDNRYASKFGLQVTRVAYDSAVEKAGIKVGDTIVSIAGQTWESDKVRLSYSFGKEGEWPEPGDRVPVVLLRLPEGSGEGAELHRIEMVLTPYSGTAPEEPATPPNDAIRPDLAEAKPPYEALCWQAIRHAGFEEASLDLLKRLALSDEYPDAHRLPICRYVRRDPFQLEGVSREISSEIGATKGRGLVDAPFFLDLAARTLLRFGPAATNAVPEPEPELPTYVDADLNGHLDYIAAVLGKAAEQRAAAFTNLVEEDITFILEHRNGLLASLLEYKMLNYDEDYERQRNCVKLLALATKVDREALVAQARLALRLVEPGFVASLRAAAEAAGKNLDGASVAARNTPHGRIVLAGRARNRHQGDTAALYDFGGDDVYANNQAGSTWEGIPTAVIVDYEGRDEPER